MSIAQVVLFGIVAYVVLMISGFHQVSEGYVGIYKKFGILQKKLAEPGYHFSIPFVEQFIEIKISIQTDQVKNVPCGTSNGTLVYFDKIQVVNKLRKDLVYKTLLNYTENYEKFWITDKIHHEINQFCSKHSLQEIYIDIFDKLDEEIMKSLNKDLDIWAPGIQILSVRVTKPNVPQRIRRNFESIERLKVDYFIASQKQNVRVQEEMTKQKKQLIKMQSNLDVIKIDLDKKIDKKSNDLKMAKIEAEMILNKEKTKIQTQFLVAFEQATLYPQLFTQKYLSFLAFDALTSNTTLTLGNKIPNIIMCNGLKGKKSKSRKQSKQPKEKVQVEQGTKKEVKENEENERPSKKVKDNEENERPSKKVKSSN